jgi:flagellar biosynthesis protein FlhB
MSKTEERTEKPTPKKKRESRRDGQIARSPELSGWIAIMAFIVIIPTVIGTAAEAGQRQFANVREVMRAPTSESLVNTLGGALRDLASVLVVPLATFLVVGVVVNVAQVGFLLTGKPLRPKAERINPIKGLKRLFSAKSAIETVKQIARMGVLGFVGWIFISQAAEWAATGEIHPLREIVRQAAVRTMTMMRIVGVAGLVIALLDYAYQRWSTNKQIRMTKQEVKDEFKQQEGNQELKQKLRSKQIAMSRNRMFSMIPQADVIVVNPIHIAVALKYEADKGAPRVVAKGEEWTAERIRMVADQHRIPIVESIPLARALYASCDVDREIPAELYEGVARLLAFVHHLRTKGAGLGTAPGTYPRLPEMAGV